MRFYKPNPRITGSAASFTVNPNSKGQGIYVEIIKQKAWDDAKKLGSFDSTKENKIHLKFTPTEIADIMMICQRQKGTVKFFHNAVTVSSQISFGVWEKDGVAKGFSLSVNKGDKKAAVSFTFAEGFLLLKWFDFALAKIFEVEYTANKSLFDRLPAEIKEQNLDE